MSERNREQLLGYLLGALDDSEQRLLDEQLIDDPELRAELAEVQRMLRPLEAARRTFEPPAGLAQRACRLVTLLAPVFEPGGRSAASWRARRVRARQMSAAVVPPSAPSGARWIDIVVAVSILVAATLLILPVVQRSRENSRLVTCQANLRDMGINHVFLAQKDPAQFGNLLRPDRQPAEPSPPSIVVSADELERGEAIRRAMRVPTAQRLAPQQSLHSGVAHQMRGQNVLFFDGHAVFVVTGPAPLAGHQWLDDAVSSVSAPVIPAADFGL